MNKMELTGTDLSLLLQDVSTFIRMGWTLLSCNFPSVDEEEPPIKEFKAILTR